MRFKKPLAALAFGAFFGVNATVASAQIQETFFGEDLDPEISMVNSMAAEADFLSYLVGVGTETFDSFVDGQTGPLALMFPGAGAATLQGTGEIEADAFAGRFAISDPNWWSVDVTSGSFFIEFEAPVAAFGFYGTDVGDFGGQMWLSFLTESGAVPVMVPHSVEGVGSVDPEGAAMFFGYIDTENPFTRIDFSAVGGYGNETFGFDNMTIGSIEQVREPVPEPATVLLLGSGLIGIGLVARRRRRHDPIV